MDKHYDWRGIMTKKQLVEKLKKFPDDMTVVSRKRVDIGLDDTGLEEDVDIYDVI